MTVAERELVYALLAMPATERTVLEAALRDAVLDAGPMAEVWLELAELVAAVDRSEERRLLADALENVRPSRSEVVDAVGFPSTMVTDALRSVPVGNIALLSALAQADGDREQREVWMALVGLVLEVSS